MVSDFWRSQPSVFSRTGPLKTKQWIVEIENFLKATRIPKKNRLCGVHSVDQYGHDMVAG